MDSISRMASTLVRSSRCTAARRSLPVVPRRQLRLDPSHAARIQAALDNVHAELQVPPDFPAEAHAEASSPAISTRGARDLTDVPFVTIDPPSSMDLDQAVHLARTPGD